MNSMNTSQQERRGYGFVIGLLAGTVAGAGLAMWLAPVAAAEIRERVSDSARRIRRRANEQYEQAGARVSEVVEDITRKRDDVRDQVAGAVARGAHEVARGAREVERAATAAKSNRA